MLTGKGSPAADPCSESLKCQQSFDLARAEYVSSRTGRPEIGLTERKGALMRTCLSLTETKFHI